MSETVTMFKATSVGETQLQPSAIVFGPRGCGKTTHAGRIAAALGLSQIIDDGYIPKRMPSLNALVLVTEEPMPDELPRGIRSLSYAQVMKLRTIPGWPYEPHAVSIAIDEPIYHNRDLSTLKAGLALGEINDALRAALDELAALQAERYRLARYHKTRNPSVARAHRRAAADLGRVERLLDQITGGRELPF